MVCAPPSDKGIKGVRCASHGFKFQKGCLGCAGAVAIWREWRMTLPDTEIEP